MRFAIMRGTPATGGTKRALKNRSPARKVPCCACCPALWPSTEHGGDCPPPDALGEDTVSPSSAPGYVGRLRSRIGQDPIRSMAGYCSIIDETEVDAFIFENMIKQYGVCEIADIDDVDSDFSDRYENLLDLHAMWHANPALHFADAHEDEFFTTVYLEFERYWDCLKRCIIYSELRSRRKPRIEKAIGRITQLLAQDPSDEQLWALLYRAQASLPAPTLGGCHV